MKATKLLAILAIASILVMGAGTFMLMGGLPASKQIIQPSTVQGRVTAYVLPPPSETTGLVRVNVLP